MSKSVSTFARMFRYFSIYGGSGLLLCGASLYYLSKKEQEHYSNYQFLNIDSRPRNLVTTGPYAFSRNPIYVSYIIMTLSLGVLSLHRIYPKYFPYSKYIILPLIIPTSIVYVCFLAVISYEEKELTLRFGTQYLHYAHRVNRWIGSDWFLSVTSISYKRVRFAVVIFQVDRCSSHFRLHQMGTTTFFSPYKWVCSNVPLKIWASFGSLWMINRQGCTVQ